VPLLHDRRTGCPYAEVRIGASYRQAKRLPEFFGRGKRVKRDFLFLYSRRDSPVMEKKAVTVGTENEGNVQGVAVAERRLHPVAVATAGTVLGPPMLKPGGKAFRMTAELEIIPQQDDFFSKRSLVGLNLQMDVKYLTAMPSEYLSLYRKSIEC
jgi:hypothetical protein